MLASAASFSVMGAIAHTLREELTWQFIALTRTSLALIFTLSLTTWARVPLVFFRPRSLWIRSLSGSVSLVLTFYALTHLPISNALTLTNMFPVWVALLTWPLLGLPPTVGVWLAVVSGLCGVILIQHPQLAGGNQLGAAAALASSFSTAVAMMGLHRLRTIDPRAIVVHFSAVSTAIVAVVCGLTGELPKLASLQTGRMAALLLGLGLTATAGQIAMTRAFALGHPPAVAVVGLTQIVFAMGFDAILWSRTFDGTTLCGIALVVAPTAWLMLHGRFDEPTLDA
jgi:drug/metabolite transporter (DMT)-like permease